MIHIALPDSSISPDKVKERPGYFADTGIPALLRLMNSKGCRIVKGGKGMIVKMAGGANVMDTNNTFNIGKRNALAAKKILWSFGMGPVAEDIGGNHSRTVSVEVKTGKIVLSCHQKGEWKL